jgi:3-oxoacyl-[acyl-carrier protein] reductase
LIFVSSVVALSGNAGQSNYSASKAGLGGLGRSLAREVGNRGITVNCVAPGFIETDMTKEIPNDVKSKLASQIPLGKFGNPSDVANAVVFLASNEASYITGNTLNVNGGMYMY